MSELKNLFLKMFADMDKTEDDPNEIIPRIVKFKNSPPIMLHVPRSHDVTQDDFPPELEFDETYCFCQRCQDRVINGYLSLCNELQRQNAMISTKFLADYFMRDDALSTWKQDKSVQWACAGIISFTAHAEHIAKGD